MKKFWTIWVGVFLLFSAQARAECYVGMSFDGDERKWEGKSVGGTWPHVCTSCSGGMCKTAKSVGATAQKCKRVNLAGAYPVCEQCIENAEWLQINNRTYNQCECKDGYYWAKTALYAGASEMKDLCVKNPEIPNGKGIECNQYDCPKWTCNSGYFRNVGRDHVMGDYSTYCKSCSVISVDNGTCTACSDIVLARKNSHQYVVKSGPTCTAAACNSGYTWNGSACVQVSCPAGQYVSGNSCVSCPSGQWSAGGTATSCSPCSSLSVSNGTCTACSATGGCSAVSCNGGYKASGASCVQVSCPAGQYVSGSSCASCPSGQWSAGGTATSCSPCSSISVANGTCAACSATGVCSELSCARKYVFRNGACVLQKCFLNTYEDEAGTCRPCSDIAVNGGVCSSCSYDGTVCESVACNEGWANDTATSCVPTKECSQNSFWDEESQSCKRCDTYIVPNGGCVECSAAGCSKAECDKANMTFSESDQKCGVECEANQYLDASFECKACPSGQFSAGGRSAEATSCTSCSTIEVDGGTCVECSVGECLKASCSTGYRPDDTGKKCLKNAANCMDGLSVTADGCCCVK